MRLLPASCRPTIASGCGSTALAASVARRQPAPRPPTAQPPRRGELHSRVTSHKAARQLHFPHQSVAACATQPNCCPLPPPASPIQASRRQWAPLVQHCREQWGARGTLCVMAWGWVTSNTRLTCRGSASRQRQPQAGAPALPTCLPACPTAPSCLPAPALPSLPGASPHHQRAPATKESPHHAAVCPLCRQG